MKIKYFLFFAICMITLNSVNAQKVKFKGDKVLLDGEEVFKFDRRGLGAELSIYTLDTNDEVLYMLTNANGTRNYRDDDFVTLNFLDKDVKFDSQNLLIGSWKKILARMFKEGVIDEKGVINDDKLNRFVSKYSRY